MPVSNTKEKKPGISKLCLTSALFFIIFLQDYNDQVQEISNKLVNIMDDSFRQLLSMVGETGILTTSL